MPPVNATRTRAFAAAAVVLVTTACGGQPAPAKVDGGALAYARCLRGHGLPSWPDPGRDGEFDKSRLTTQALGAGAAQIQAAQTACRSLLPARGTPSPSRRARVTAQALAFSRCIRSHGVPRFPDPGSSGRIPDPASAGVDQGSPQFERANRDCRALRPPYIPSNSAYDTWARTR